MQPNELIRLDKWDPQEAWKPWQPTPAEPWNLKWAAHLLRRAAFGYPAQRENEDSWAALSRVFKQGVSATLDELFQPPDSAFDEIVDTAGRSIVAEGAADELRGWWLYRMLSSPTPLRERMTLFWHNHFATSLNKVGRVELMYQQNNTLREHALGLFEPLLLAVSRDPAMIIWLDLERNARGSVNENFGRELMELFTLGVGHYSESDVRNMARAFTGWRIAGVRSEFVPERFDDGPKTLFGQTGNFDGQAALKILLGQPAAARFIVRKLFRHFVSEGEVPPDALLEPLVDEFRRSNFDISQTLRRILASRLFFSNSAYRQRIKSPTELIVGAVLALEGNFEMTTLVSMMEGLGQELFAPPNVKGWEEGKAWLNTATLLGRDNMLWQIVGYPLMPQQRNRNAAEPSKAIPGRCDPARLATSHVGRDPAGQVRFLADLFLQGDLAESSKQKLIDYYKNFDALSLLKDAPKETARADRLRKTLHMLLVLPEYQLA